MKAFYRNKTILVTGAASGIGRAFAREVSRYGVTLILWDLDMGELRSLRNELHDTTEALISRVDVTDQNAIGEEADQIIKSRFLPDIIVNCAGVVTGKLFKDHSAEEIQRNLSVNAAGSMLVTRAFLSDMISRGSGQIVNLASASGYIGNPRMSVYAASKWAVIGWSESLRQEMNLENTGIGVTCVIPGYVNTGMFEGVQAPLLLPILDTETLVKKMAKGIRKQRFKIQTPFLVKLTPALKALLPRSVFDWLAGRVLRVYHSMDTFQGRISENP